MLLSDIADGFLTRTLADTTHERPEGGRSDHMDRKELCEGRTIRSSQGPLLWKAPQHPKDRALTLVECLLDLTRQLLGTPEVFLVANRPRANIENALCGVMHRHQAIAGEPSNVAGRDRVISPVCACHGHKIRRLAGILPFTPF